MQADCGRFRLGNRALACIPVVVLVMSVEPLAVLAQEPSSASLAPPPSLELVAGEAGPVSPSASQGPELVRVPPPSGHLARFSLGAISTQKATGSASSRSWWLGSTGIALVLAICGAICVAARKYRPRDSAGLVHVVSRVSLTPRHSIFVVRAGQRSLLIGTGAQGAPTLLGELTEADQAVNWADPAGGLSPRSRIRGDHPLEAWNQGTMPVVDLRLEEEE